MRLAPDRDAVFHAFARLLAPTPEARAVLVHVLGYVRACVRCGRRRRLGGLAVCRWCHRPVEG
jgi:hypothetical protein